MEDYVNERRSSRNPHPRQHMDDAEDGYEDGMRVPSSVLNDCNDSFVAADDKRQKASTQFFSETGIMAMLCRHDRVLWTVSMTSAGEKQHYALLLVKRLFEHIPENMTVGLLYDIGCQLHRSCLKWGFLDEFISRITFGISVFHAYGHQWARQIIYHPRKCPGFGLTDGEGCERFWDAIKLLIPLLRVSGVRCSTFTYHDVYSSPLQYHQRLFTLDTQIQHLDQKSLQGLGHWLYRRWHHCQSKKREAEAELERCEVHQDVLRAEWAAQLAEQTKPAPRQCSHLIQGFC